MPNEIAKNSGPEAGDAEEAVAAGPPRRDMERGDIGRQPDGEARKDDVERDSEAELQPRQQDGIEVHVFLAAMQDTSKTLGAQNACGVPVDMSASAADCARGRLCRAAPDAMLAFVRDEGARP